MQLLANGKQQFIDGSGAPLASGKVYFYAPGTLTPATTYQDAAGSIPNTNPVNLDSLGQAVIWGTGTFRQIVKDVGGSQIWDQIVSSPDLNAPLVSLGGAAGSALVGFQQGGGGSISRLVQDKLRETVSVKDFGAKGDGVTVDTAAIQNGINWAVVNNAALRIPSGVYIVDAPLTMTLASASGGTNYKGVRARIYGDGAENTLLFYVGASVNPVLTVTGAGTYDDETTVRGFRINRSFSTPAGTGALFTKTTVLGLEDMAFSGFNYGFQLVDVNQVNLYKVKAVNNNTGFYAQQSTGTTAPNALKFDTCSFASNTVSAGTILKGTANTFINTDFEGNGNGTASILTLTYDGTTGGTAAAFHGCYFEGGYGAADIYMTLLAGCGVGNLVVNGCTFNRINATNFTTNNIIVDGSALSAGASTFNVQVRGCGFMGYAPYSASSARPTISLAPGGGTYDGFRCNDLLNDNVFTNPAIDPPGIPLGAIVNGEAVARIAADGSLSSSAGITAVSHTPGSGLYTLTIPRLALVSGSAVVSVTPATSAIATATANVASTTTINVQTGNASNAVADIPFHIRVKMR